MIQLKRVYVEFSRKDGLRILVDPTLKTLIRLLERDDVVIDGGNSYYHCDIRRFSSRGEDDFADKILSALRYQLGGHEEKAATNKVEA